MYNISHTSKTYFREGTNGLAFENLRILNNTSLFEHLCVVNRAMTDLCFHSRRRRHIIIFTINTGIVLYHTCLESDPNVKLLFLYILHLIKSI